MPESLRLVIMTPHDTVIDEPVLGVRLPAETGQVGLRPHGEPLSLAVEAGLVVVHRETGRQFAATAGGLLEHQRGTTTLYTPFAVLGDDERTVLDALDQALRTPDRELAARRRLGELEQEIVSELRHRPGVARARGANA